MAKPSPLQCVVTLAVWAVLCAASYAQTTQPAEQPGGSSAPATAPSLPHMRVDVKNRVVDLSATVVLREADWLELLACSPGGREHESILTVAARPSHIHLALVMIGLEPGKPLDYFKEDGKWVITPPRGPKVQVSILYDPAILAADEDEADDDSPEPEARVPDKPATQPAKRETAAAPPVPKPTDTWVEVPASSWIKHQRTGLFLPDSNWLFTGSGMIEWEGKQHYRADLNGTILSLVNFSDDLLARSTRLTNDNDDGAWGANTNAIPPKGSKVIVRLRPAAEVEPHSDEPMVLEARPTSRPSDDAEK